MIPWMNHPPTASKTEMKSKAILLLFTIAVMIFLSACTGEVNGVPEPRAASVSVITNGRRLIANYGCGSCHTIPGVPGANSMAAPPLKCFYQRSYIAGRLANNKENLVKWIQDPQEIEPGNAMPDLGVSEDEAGDMADYLYDPLEFWGLINVPGRKCSE
jgi:cytochrome c